MSASRCNSAQIIQDSMWRIAGVALGLWLGASSSLAVAPRPISGSSPFANCVADNPTGQVGTLFQDSEIEPQIAVNPTRSTNIIAAWQQDRWSNGGARGPVAGISIDGGLTWAKIVPPRITKCSGGTYERASDPWVTIGPSGRAFLMNLGFMQDRPDGGFGNNAMLVSHSDNGGMTWTVPKPLIIDTNGQILNDKNSIKADPNDSRYVYAVWDRLQDFTLPPGSQSIGKASVVAGRTGEGAALARERRRSIRDIAPASNTSASAVPLFFKGPSYLARTSDGGRSWELPQKIHDPGRNSQTINNLVEVLPSGEVLVFFTNFANLFVNGGFETHINLGFVKSTDKGAHFGVARLPIEMNVTWNGTRTPDFHEPVRDANILFDTAVDRSNGNIYVVWQDGRWGNLDKIAFSQSTDTGATWSEPIRINMTPVSDVRLRNQAFIPTVEVGAGHTVVVTYYDFRFDSGGNNEWTDYFAVKCTPSHGVDCSKRSNWGNGTTALTDIRLTPQSFDMLDAPVARGHFLGDYMGLARRGKEVIPAFGIAESLDHASIYTRPIQ